MHNFTKPKGSYVSFKFYIGIKMFKLLNFNTQTLNTCTHAHTHSERMTFVDWLQMTLFLILDFLWSKKFDYKFLSEIRTA